MNEPMKGFTPKQYNSPIQFEGGIGLLIPTYLYVDGQAFRLKQRKNTAGDLGEFRHATVRKRKLTLSATV